MKSQKNTEKSRVLPTSGNVDNVENVCRKLSDEWKIKECNGQKKSTLRMG
jgi:hypothetical protein